MKTKVKFYRGTHGMGIVISVVYDKDRIIFDFGAPFTPLANVYDGFVKPRDKNRVKDAILLGRIPEVEGVFAKKDLDDLNILSYEECDLNTAVFICHLHLDHMSEIDKVHKDIPVYIHKDGLKMQQIIDEMEENKVYRTYSAFDYYETIHTGNISVTPYFSDHPCAGSSSFLIKTPDATILYSGDIRYHGNYSDKAFKEMELLSKEHIDLFIVDATTTSPSEYEGKLLLEPSKDLLPGCVKEQDLYDGIYEDTKDFKGISVFNMYPRDINMLISMNELGKKLNRTTVFEPYYANILYQLKGIASMILTDEDDKSYVKALDKVCKKVTLDEIVQHPECYLLQNSYRHILNLTDFDGIEGNYFHLLGEPLVKGTKQWNIMLNIINKLNWSFKSYINLYSFSHSYPNHLTYVVDTINADVVVPVHSRKPEALDPCHSKLVISEDGVEYIINNGLIKC